MKKPLKTCVASMGDGECHDKRCPNPTRDLLLGKCPLPRLNRDDESGPHDEARRAKGTP